MKSIKIKDIRPEGSIIEDSIAPDVIGNREDDNFKFLMPVKVEGKIERISDEIILNFTVEGKFESFCYRCLKSVEKEWQKSFSLNFEADKNKEFLEVEDDIRQEIILNLPNRILCKEDCKGLCPKCGKDLNEGSCNCSKNNIN